MYKKFPSLFPDLLADFQLIKVSSDETDYEWSGFNYYQILTYFFPFLISCIT